MEERSIRIVPFSVEMGNWCMWSWKFLARSGQLGCDIILRCTVKALTVNLEEKDKEDAIFKLLNKNVHNDKNLFPYF